jgi:hypothetical protein
MSKDGKKIKKKGSVSMQGLILEIRSMQLQYRKVVMQ